MTSSNVNPSIRAADKQALRDRLAKDARKTVAAVLETRHSTRGRADLEILYELCAERGMLNSLLLPMLDRAEAEQAKKASVVDCHECSGSGMVACPMCGHETECLECDGEGTVEDD